MGLGWTMTLYSNGGHVLTKRSGFTLLEILLAMILSGFLALALTKAWDLVWQQWWRIEWRQKGLMVLHGHMERLAAVYRHGEVAKGSVTFFNTSGYPAGHANRQANHSILIANTGLDWVTISSADFLTTPGNEGTILYLDTDTNGPSVADRNVVWLDRREGLVGVLSWTQEATDWIGSCYDGTAGSPCVLQAVYLDFPYRLSDQGKLTPVLDVPDVISLRTIMGRRY